MQRPWDNGKSEMNLPVCLIQLEPQDESPFRRPNISERIEGKALPLPEDVSVSLAEFPQPPRRVERRAARGRLQALRKLPDHGAALARSREPHLPLLAVAAHAHIAVVLARVLAPRLVRAADDVPLEPQAAELLQPDGPLALRVGHAPAVIGRRGAVVLSAAALHEAQGSAHCLGGCARKAVAADRAPLREPPHISRSERKPEQGVRTSPACRERPPACTRSACSQSAESARNPGPPNLPILSVAARIRLVSAAIPDAWPPAKTISL